MSKFLIGIKKSEFENWDLISEGKFIKVIIVMEAESKKDALLKVRKFDIRANFVSSKASTIKNAYSLLLSRNGGNNVY